MPSNFSWLSSVPQQSSPSSFEKCSVQYGLFKNGSIVNATATRRTGDGDAAPDPKNADVQKEASDEIRVNIDTTLYSAEDQCFGKLNKFEHDPKGRKVSTKTVTLNSSSGPKEEPCFFHPNHFEHYPMNGTLSVDNISNTGVDDAKLEFDLDDDGDNDGNNSDNSPDDCDWPGFLLDLQRNEYLFQSLVFDSITTGNDFAIIRTLNNDLGSIRNELNIAGNMDEMYSETIKLLRTPSHVRSHACDELLQGVVEKAKNWTIFDWADILEIPLSQIQQLLLHPHNFKSLDESLRNNLFLCLIGVLLGNFDNLKSVGPRHKDNFNSLVFQNLVYETVMNGDPRALELANGTTQDVLMAECPELFPEVMPPGFCEGDRHLFDSGMRGKGAALCEANEWIKANATAVYLAVKDSPLAFQFASSDLKTNERYVTHLVQHRCEVFFYIPCHFVRQHPAIAAKALLTMCSRKTSQYDHYLPEVRLSYQSLALIRRFCNHVERNCLLLYDEFWIGWVGDFPHLLRYLPGRTRCNPDFIVQIPNVINSVILLFRVGLTNTLRRLVFDDIWQMVTEIYRKRLSEVSRELSTILPPDEIPDWVSHGPLPWGEVGWCENFMNELVTNPFLCLEFECMRSLDAQLNARLVREKYNEWFVTPLCRAFEVIRKRLIQNENSTGVPMKDFKCWNEASYTMDVDDISKKMSQMSVEKMLAGSKIGTLSRSTNLMSTDTFSVSGAQSTVYSGSERQSTALKYSSSKFSSLVDNIDFVNRSNAGERQSVSVHTDNDTLISEESVDSELIVVDEAHLVNENNLTEPQRDGQIVVPPPDDLPPDHPRPRLPEKHTDIDIVFHNNAKGDIKKECDNRAAFKYYRQFIACNMEEYRRLKENGTTTDKTKFLNALVEELIEKQRRNFFEYNLVQTQLPTENKDKPPAAQNYKTKDITNDKRKRKDKIRISLVNAIEVKYGTKKKNH